MSTPRTKIEAIMFQSGITQAELIKRIFNVAGHKIMKYSLSNIVTGKLKNYTLQTASFIAQGLGVSINEIVEEDIINAKGDHYEH